MLNIQEADLSETPALGLCADLRERAREREQEGKSERESVGIHPLNIHSLN